MESLDASRAARELSRITAQKELEHRLRTGSSPLRRADRLAPFRVALERMLIRTFATVGGIGWIEVGGCSLANDKVDR